MYKSIYSKTNSADPDQIASSEATDLYLHCLQRQGISGISRTRVKHFEKSLILKCLTMHLAGWKTPLFERQHQKTKRRFSIFVMMSTVGGTICRLSMTILCLRRKQPLSCQFIKEIL